MLGAQGDHPARKKYKMITDIGPVQNGVASASNTPTIDEGRVVDILSREEQDTSLFFDTPPQEYDPEEYEVPTFVRNVLRSNRASEEALRNAVFTHLFSAHGITFPESSHHTGFEKALRNTFRIKIKKYVESDLSSLLVEYSKMDGKPMERFMQGLPVTTTSKPDLAPLDNRESDVQIRMGEFKNAKKYNIDKARTQCTMYLLGLLYWLRVQLGKPVETVYGFFFCGTRCEDQDGTYTVGLIRLSAPQNLGEEIEAHYMTETESVDNMNPLHLLINFLKRGKRWSIKNFILEESRRVPSVFTLPTSLWANQNNDEHEVIIYGTLSIVLRIRGRSLQNFLSDDTPHFERFRNTREWMDFCGDVKQLLECGSNDNSAWYFLKIRSKDTSLQDKPMGAMADVWDLLTIHQSSESEAQTVARNSMSKTYPIRPCTISSRSIGRFGVILMRNRGRSLRNVYSFSNATKIVKEFQKVIQTAMFLSVWLPHGDALPHNLVYDEDTEELTLIDIDEGVCGKQGGNAHLWKRVNRYAGDDGDWYIALSYPNAIRKMAESYTQCQLVASFLFLMGRMNENAKNTLSNNTFLLLHNLQEASTKLGEELMRLDNAKELQSAIKKQITAKVGEVYQAMTNIVNYIIAA